MTRVVAAFLPLLLLLLPVTAAVDEGAQKEWFVAAKAGNLGRLKELSKDPAVDVTAGDYLVGQSALVKAVFNGHAEAAEWLLAEIKLDPNGELADPTSSSAFSTHCRSKTSSP